jgi:hypothetical protein
MAGPDGDDPLAIVSIYRYTGAMQEMGNPLISLLKRPVGRGAYTDRSLLL